MKSIFFLILLAVPLRAELLVTFQTTRGNVVVALQYEKAPQAVANFITLAQGTRTRIDPFTGAVIRKPMYVGEKFYRVLNDPGFKIAQTGSGTGNNSGGPGYTFRDEFHTSLTHVPYVLSMANGGPHTNGSQIFLTGNATIPGLDNVHTIFGLITAPASRTVIDSIMAAGNDGTTINGVSFQRTSPAAQSFNEHGQYLPLCSGIAGMLEVKPGVETIYHLAAAQSPGSVVKTFRSTDLQSWDELDSKYQDPEELGGFEIRTDDALLPSAFYHLSMITTPDPMAPVSHAGRTLVAGLFGSQTLTFQFDSTGQGGVVTYSESPGQPTQITGVSYAPSPYSMNVIIETSLYNPFLFRCGLDSSKMPPNLSAGRPLLNGMDFNGTL